MGYGPRAGLGPMVGLLPLASRQIKNKYTNYKGIKNNTNFGQITRIQDKVDRTCK